MVCCQAVALIQHYGSTDAQKAADFLAKEAWDRWIREEGEALAFGLLWAPGGAVVDDITVILVYLKASGN